MSRGLTNLASIAATASFVGFFGTVLGLMNSFPSIGGSSSSWLAEVAHRISDAMVPGILGLFVAVIAFWFHRYLHNQMQAFELEMQNASVDLVNRLVVHLERLRTANPTVWRALTGVPRKAAAHWEPSAERVLDGPSLVWEPMYRHGLLELIWPQLKSEFDAAVTLDATALVCYGCGILGWLAYWMQHRLITGFLVLAFFVVAGIAIRRGSRVAVAVTHAYLFIVGCASIRSYGLTFGAVCVLAVGVPLVGALRAVKRHVAVNSIRRSLPHPWSLLLISLAAVTTMAVLSGTVYGLFRTQSYDDSMEPTIPIGDRLIGLNASFAGSIHRNEVWEVNWGGLVGSVRVVGLPGDRVQIRQGVLVLNGKRLRETHCIPYSKALGDFPLPSKAYSDELLRVYHEGAYGETLDQATEYVVPHNSYFGLNDNRKRLSDSRTMGPVPRTQFVARLMVAYGASGSIFKLDRIL